MRSCLSGSKELYTFKHMYSYKGECRTVCMYIPLRYRYVPLGEGQYDVLAASASHLSRAPGFGRMNTECLIITGF